MKNYLFLLVALFLFSNFQCEDDPILPQSVTISGAVYVAANNSSGDLIPWEEADIRLYADGELIATAENGTFEFTDLEPGRNYTLHPEKIDDQLSGVTAFDVALLEAYLKDSVEFNLRQMIAADMDKSHHVNEDDLTILKECILSPMMVYCLDYRFYLEHCTSLSQRALINNIEFNNLVSDRLDLRILPVKSGEINGG